MSDISGSLIQPWLDFRLDNLPVTLPQCWDGRVHPSCTGVCDNASYLLEPDHPENMMTCGLWSTLTMMHIYGADTVSDDAGPIPASILLERFNPLDLDDKNASLASASRNAISTAMIAMLRLTRIATYQGNTLGGPCSEQVLFPPAPFQFNGDLSGPLHECVNAICSPSSLNSDLGGIGVSVNISNNSNQSLIRLH